MTARPTLPRFGGSVESGWALCRYGPHSNDMGRIRTIGRGTKRLHKRIMLETCRGGMRQAQHGGCDVPVGLLGRDGDISVLDRLIRLFRASGLLTYPPGPANHPGR